MFHEHTSLLEKNVFRKEFEMASTHWYFALDNVSALRKGQLAAGDINS